MFGLILMGVSMAISAKGAYEQSRAQEAMADYNAKVAEANAKAEADAIDAERRHRAKGARKQMGKMRANYSSREVNIESGSPLVMLADEANENAFDQLEMKRQGDIALAGGKTQSSLLQMEADAARRAGNWNIAGGVAKGASKMYGAYSDYAEEKKKGVV